MAGVHNVLDAGFAKLREVPPDLHLFCPRISPDDDEIYEDPDAPSSISPAEKQQRIEDGQTRLDLMYNCSLILGLSREAAGPHRPDFDSRCDTFLTTCASCVRNWHKGRAAFLKDITSIYEDSVIEEMRNRLNQFDFDRITQGLEAAEKFILAHNSIVTQSTFIKEGQADLLVSIYESLCCIAYLSTPGNRKHFNFVFTTIQQRKPLKLDEVLPTTTIFLFDEDQTRRDFAVQTFERKPLVTKSDFDWAINDSLTDAILKANSKSTDDHTLQRTWQGFLYILDVLEENIVMECLRGMAVQPSIYELMISQMPQLQSAAVLRAVLKAFCGLIQKSPKAFWDAYSQWSPPSILEQIIRSPAFRPLLLQSGEHDMTPDGPAAVSWVKPLINSISPNQKTDVCDKLVHHLLGDFANDQGMSSEGKFACYRGATEALSSSLAGFVSPKYRLHAGSSTIHTNALLNLTLKYKDLIVQLAELPASDPQQASLSKAALDVVGSALALDSRITAEECNALQENENLVQREVKRDSAGLWEAFLEILQPGAYEFAKAMLSAFTPLTTVETFRPLKNTKLSQIKIDFNSEFQKTAEVIERVLSRLESFNSTAIGQLCLEPTTMYPIVATLIHGEESVSQAGASFIKAITGEEDGKRSDAVSKLVGMHFVPVISSYTKVVSDITLKRSLWSPQRNIILYSREILDALCNPASGIIRSRDLTITEQGVLRNWWSSQWVFLENALNQTDAWSRKVDMETMKNFCRTVMEHAEALLAQDGLLASALSAGSAHSTSTVSGDASNESMKDILEKPRIHCMGLCKMLRLKDLYLVSVIVNVLGKLLKRLREFDMEVPGAPLAYIKDTCIRTENGRYKTMTNMNDRQRAELIKALGEEDTKDDIEILSIKKVEGPKKQTKLDAWSKTGSEAPSTPAALKPMLKSGKDDVRELLKGSSSEKSRSILERMNARQAATKSAPKALPKTLPKAPPIASIPSIREKRAKEAEEKRKRDAEAIARARALRAPKQTVAGEGSGLQGLSGIQGKDFAPVQKSEIMVNSSSEDEDDSDDDVEFLKRTGTALKNNDAQNRIQSMKLNPRGPVKKTKLQRSAKDMRARLIPPMDILHQAILEWDIFHEGNDPPNGITCSRVAESYYDPQQYKQTFLPLLINEAWRSFVTAKDEATSKPFETKVVNRMNVDKFIEVSTAMPITNNKDRFLSEGDIVLFSLAANPLEAKDELHCLARIWRIQFKNGSLEVQYRLSSRAGPIISNLMPQAEFYAIKITNMTTIEREYASLESLQYYDLAPEILEAKPSPMLSFSEEAVDKAMKNYHLNQGQAKAILHAKENDAFTLVQGPPGTGKTKTIVAMVGALMGGAQSAQSMGTAIKRPDGLASTSNKGVSKKLLVCAPSNAAVDELVLRLKAGVKSMNGTFHKINVLRLGRSDAINAAVRDVTLDELVKARVEGTEKENNGPSSRELMHQEAGQIKKELGELRPQLEAARETGDRAEINRLQRKFDEYKRRQAQIGAKIDADKDSGNTAARESEIRRRQIQQEILDSAQVLCATLSGSGHEMFKNLAVEFETVIIDEAAQCVELSALIPLKYGCSKCILVGDPKQLPPTVLSQSAARYGYDQSLFVRMQRNFPDDVHLLDTQYRMHPEISLFPSQEFYERRLVDGGDMAKLRHQPWHQSELLGPYRFFDVKGIQEKGHRGKSLVNLEELKVAMQLYERFTLDYPQVDLKGKIGIITPYKAQLFELREKFTRRYGEKITEYIEFNTTDAFQGRECEIIIFSCVRASSTGGIGFMTDIRRMNVGLTRAKSSLWILGDSRALVQGEFWNKLIEDSKARNRYSAGDILGMLKKPGARLPSSTNRSGPSPISSSSPSPLPQNAQGLGASIMAEPYGGSSPGNSSRRGAEDVIMEDVPPVKPTVPNKFKTPQLPETYTLIERNRSTNSAPSVSFGGLNERGEPAIVPRSSSERPIIHESGLKRHRDDPEAGKSSKRVAKEGAGRNPPTGPRAMPRPQDPAAMAVLGIPTNPSSNMGKAPTAPPNAPKGPSVPRPPRPMVPPKKRNAGDPFIKRKPNKPH
ncbi:SEN1 N terminal-domain-containing protein [Xylaria bambusicola]|uniref:SEN1 N terminal-domain-containing protein n=1 Tax=Xylaria bambusicola TaxID=326684 RepID=UPI002007D78C|nr:SEN1 N terminal-domain-containing protein [Xylaria bambusicola]KAI0522255.1 SEN1 N terminal-domain-containing protein [Xylaria bambusicola]